MGRLQAVVRRCAFQGGDCPCLPNQCKAKDALHEEFMGITEQRRELNRRESEHERLEAWLNRKPGTVRPDWERPEKPEGDYRLCVHQDTDEWSPGWYSETEADDWIQITGDAAWPFVEETAWPDDLERLGFEVV